MVLGAGEKLHVMTRRAHESDPRRHFAGTVRVVEGEVARVEGYAFLFSSNRNEWVRRPELRTRIISLSDASNVINILPAGVEVGRLAYRVVEGRLVITDGAGFTLDVNEFGANR